MKNEAKMEPIDEVAGRLGLEPQEVESYGRYKAKLSLRVMERLKDLEAVAYVRFASVYREFKDVNTFMDELKKFLV